MFLLLQSQLTTIKIINAYEINIKPPLLVVKSDEIT